MDKSLRMKVDQVSLKRMNELNTSSTTVPSHLSPVACHLLRVRPSGHFPSRGYHSVTRDDHRLSVRLTTCPAQQIISYVHDDIIRTTHLMESLIGLNALS